MIIAGETELAETLQMELNRQGYQVSVIHDGLRGILAVKRIVPDLVIISWSPPRLSGVEICCRLKSSHSDVPVILLTQGSNARERIAGLQAGASDCVSPPFVKEEFFARIQANLAHFGPGQAQESVLHCADLRLNRSTREVFRNGRFVQLTAKEFDLLEYMMNHYFQVLTREQILENVWGYSFMGSSNIIEVYIRYLRQKLEATQENRLIHTVRGVGYILREAV
ncbi:MAG: response regulator transcription factor [Cyanobacteria bacterium P01_D01_bin.44]